MINFNDLNKAAAPQIGQLSIGGILTRGGVNLIDLAFFAVGLVFMSSLFIAAFNYAGSQGDAKKISDAGTRISNSLLGLAITFASFVIVKLVASVFGYGNLAPF